MDRVGEELEKHYKKHWYYISESYCPQCGSYKIYRERRYSGKPKSWDKRHETTDAWDGCEV